ncbi:hypothetical protein KNP414_00022 [Paenibacillus mucilaginosus KNP414]|uniref:Uncharacterized protein n=1 Tax=Paenibacillus mucilaginosus (strain KNP414) TaxID=1036673 RepID=F8FH24_PAEMK|nr:hypothetical protein KNP414_00022 [Paenibacillus mucilaginosus KNP414]
MVSTSIMNYPHFTTKKRKREPFLRSSLYIFFANAQKLLRLY